MKTAKIPGEVRGIKKIEFKKKNFKLQVFYALLPQGTMNFLKKRLPIRCSGLANYS